MRAGGALGGAPGVHTAEFATVGGRRDWEAARAKLHRALGERPREAAFVCALVLAWPDARELLAEARCEGTIVWPPRPPDGGYGLEPIFQPAGSPLTFSEMDPAAKALWSAAGALMDLKKHGERVSATRTP